MMDEKWIQETDQNETYNKIETFLENGNPILLIADSASALSSEKIGHSTAFMEPAEVYGIMYDSVNNITYCYSSIGYETTQAIEYAQKWTSDIKSPTISPASTTSSNAPVIYSLTRVQSSFGEMTIETKYTKYEVNSNTSIILTEYCLIGDPYTEDSIWDNWIAIADMKIWCDHENSSILEYGPTTSSSTRTTHNVKFNGTYSGVNINVDRSYSVNESSTTVSKSGQSFSVYHDIDEWGSDKLSTKIMKPGTLCIANKGSNIFSYQETEHYAVTYYKDSIVVSDKYVTDECSMTVTLI